MQTSDIEARIIRIESLVLMFMSFMAGPESLNDPSQFQAMRKQMEGIVDQISSEMRAAAKL